MAMKNFVCMKWGTLYDAGYVNKLYAMVKRNVTGAFRFVCLTDDSNGINPAVECLDCPGVSLPPPWNNTGWRKVALWSEQLPGMQGDWLFLDLDVVITGSLDAFFQHEPDKSFVVMQNWTQPGEGIGNTSVYRFTVGRHPYLLSGMLEDFMSVVKRYRNEQTFVSRVISEIAFWPDEWCILFKIQCVPPMPARWWKAPVLPTGARIVAFPGLPNPGDAANGIWPEKKFYKRLYKHIRPAAWIAKHWRE